jgi:hypothetical protein
MSREQLLVFIGEQAKQIAALRALNEELTTRLARVEHLLSRNSGNSSMPPSRTTIRAGRRRRRGSAVVVRRGPEANSRERQAPTSPGSSGPTTNRIGSRRGVANAGTIWPTPPT